MAYLTKDKVVEIIKNAPAGTTPAGIVAALRAQGHELEGYGGVQKPQENKTIAPPSSTTPAMPENTTGKPYSMFNPAPLAPSGGVVSQATEAERTASAKEHPVLEAVSGVTRGVGKSAVNALAGVSELGMQAVAPIVNPAIKSLSGALGREYNPVTPERPQGLEQATTPQGTAEKVGGFGGDVAQFFIPGAAIGKLGKVGKIAKALKGVDAMKAPTIIKGAIKASPIVAGEAAGAAGITAAQQGKVDENVGTAALLGGGFSAASKIISPLSQLLKGKIASRTINSLIKPSEKSLAFGKNPGAQIAKEGIVATSFNDLLNKTSQKSSEVNKLLTKQVSEKATGETVNAAKTIQETANKFTEKVTDPAAAQKFQNIIDQLFNTVKFQEGKLVKTGTRDLSKLGAVELHKLQQKVGKLTTWTGQGYDKDVNKILASIYGKLGEELNRIAPGTKALQTRSANLLEAVKSIGKRKATIERANQFMNLSPVLMGGAATGVGLASGQGSIPSALGGAAVLGLTKVMGSAAAKTLVAKVLSKEGIEPSVIKLIQSLILKSKVKEGDSIQQSQQKSNKEQ